MEVGEGVVRTDTKVGVTGRPWEELTVHQCQTHPLWTPWVGLVPGPV